jgi:hypothetical protein
MRRYIEGSGKSKYSINRDSRSQTFKDHKRGWRYIASGGGGGVGGGRGGAGGSLAILGFDSGSHEKADHFPLLIKYLIRNNNINNNPSRFRPS